MQSDPEIFYKDEMTEVEPKFQFSSDYITFKIAPLTQFLSSFKTQQNTRYLEIGAFEGLTTIWMMKNIFVHRGSRVTIVDSFEDPQTKRLIPNLKLAEVFNRCQILKGYSQDILKTLPNDAFDVIMVDGSHRVTDALQDMVLSWLLLKVGGYMIIDDYAIETHPLMSPKVAADSFLEVFKTDLEVIYKGYFIIIKKKDIFHPDPEEFKKYD